jgi:sulfur-oxidizing protein SoxX
MKKTIALAMFATAAIAASSCAPLRDAAAPTNDAATQAAVALMKKDFRSRGEATVDRLDQDSVQELCTRYAKDGQVPADVARRIETEQTSTIRYPVDGRYLGDWKAGEKIAQTGVGKQWSDDPKKPAGGNCYACHELSGTELAFGTIGPSLRRFGKLRGSTPAMQRYVYAKVYNPDAFTACSSMPRFGHKAILTEQQIKDVVALLLDPDSPVNR